MTIEISFKKISHRELSPSQRRALRRALRYVDQSYFSDSRLRYNLTSCEGFISVVAYSEAGKSGTLARLRFSKRVHVAIGPRGGIEVLNADANLDSKKATAHARKYL